jgi:DNA excision repair protein ERCC-4
MATEVKPIVIVDTREQRSWSFDPKLFDVQRSTLTTGDYSIVGLENVVTVERKSLGDLVSTVTHDWIRFRKELYRLAGFQFAAIIVEADSSDLWEHRYEAQVDPASVWGRCNDCFISHGVPVLWWGSRKYCEPAAGRLFKLLARKYTEGVSHGGAD